MRGALFTALAVVLLAAACGGADDERVTLAELERELVCPTCNTTLGLSNAPVADRMRALIRERIAAGASESEIKAELVAQFGEGVLAAPPKEGFNLLAWLLPLAGGAVAVAVLAFALRRWSSGRADAEVAGDPSVNGRPPLDPELERRLDEELARFDG
ncbi:MAG: cytochrome c-type biogenesis protein [Gaiellaceae bacterium]